MFASARSKLIPFSVWPVFTTDRVGECAKCSTQLDYQLIIPLSVVKEVAWNRLSQYFGLPPTIQKSVHFFHQRTKNARPPTTPLITLYHLRNTKNPDVMSNTVPSISAPHHLSDNVVGRELPCISVKLLANPTPPSTRKKRTNVQVWLKISVPAWMPGTYLSCQ